MANGLVELAANETKLVDAVRRSEVVEEVGEDGSHESSVRARGSGAPPVYGEMRLD